MSSTAPGRELDPAPAAPQAERRDVSGPAPVDRVLELQRRYGNRAVARALAPGRRGVPLSRRVLQRLRFNIGTVSVDVDYGGLSTIADPAAEIELRYASFTGSAVPATVHARIAALSATGRRWVLYGVSILQRNAAAAPGLNPAAAVDRLVARAPAATTSPTAPGLDFENEVLRVSGWSERALSAPLTAPTGATLTSITALYNPPRPGATLDTAILSAELPPALTALLIARDPQSWTSVGTVQLPQLQTIADEIQREARTFFAPYADTAMTTPYASGWQYSGQLFDVTSMVPTRDQRLGYLLNRGELVGRDDSSGPSIFSRANYDSGEPSHRAALLALVTTMEAVPATRARVNRLIRHTGRTRRNPLRVGISTEFDLGTHSECEQRWRDIVTLCHELCHALVHPSFTARESSIRFGQIVREGYTEVLGVQLYDHIRARAAADAGFKGRMEAGLPATPCAAPPAVTIGYGQAGANAEAIRSMVGDDNFRAAYFLGAVDLVGL